MVPLPIKMKARILGQINKHDNYPMFSIEDFQNIQNDHKKQQYLLKYLQYFLVRLDPQNTQHQKINNQVLQSFKDFSDVLSKFFSILLPDNFDSILQILPIENLILETIPNASNFLQLIDLIIYQYFQTSNFNIQKSSSAAIFALFSVKEFCKCFVDSGKYIDMIMTLIDFSNSQLIQFFLDFFLHDIFIQCIIEEDIQNFKDEKVNNGQNHLNCSRLVTYLFTKIFNAVTKKETARYQLIEFGSKIIVNIYNSLRINNQLNQSEQEEISNLFIQNLSSLHLYQKTNDFFIKHPSADFMPKFYNNLLLNLNNNKNNMQFNPTVMRYLHELYINDKFSVKDGRVIVMHFFHTLNINYFSNENNFRILDWINDSVFMSSFLFQLTTSFLSKCVYYDPSFLSSFIDFFIQKISPPAKESFVYNEIFSWILSLISLLFDNEHKNDENHYIFKVKKFLSSFLYEPSISDVSYYLIHFFNFRQLLLHISVLGKDIDKRNFESKKILINSEGKIITKESNNNLILQIDESIFDEQYFSRIVELIEFNRNKDSLQEFFLNYLKNSFGKNLILYFFQNICLSSKIQILLFSFTQKFPEKFIEIIVSFQLLDELIKDLNEESSVPFFKIINSIAVKTNNHFFDDYIINNINYNSPIMKINLKKVENFILPAFYDDPIPFPSLIPLLFINDDEIQKEKLNCKSPYNNYLLGNYALPIFNKFNIPVSKIPCLEEIINQFIRFKDFCYIFQNGPKEASMRIQAGKQPEFPFNLYEVFPSEKPSGILLNITANFAAFKIRFETKYHIQNSLFIINGSPIIFIKDDKLFDALNNSIGTIQLHKWYMFSFFYNKMLKNLSICLDSEVVSTLMVSLKDSSYKINSIGSLQNPTSIHYMIMNSIALGATSDQCNFSEELASRYFVPQGNISFAPNYSFHHLFNSKLAFSRFCQIMETTEFNKQATFNLNDPRNRRKSTYKRNNVFIDEIQKRYHDEVVLFVLLINNWASSHNNNNSLEWYLHRYLFCLMQNIEYCEPFYLTSILHTIINLRDKNSRTKLFHCFICDYFFWTKFPERIVGQCLDFINNYIDDFASTFDIKILEETKIGEFLLSITYFFRNSFMLNGLIRFLKTLFISFDEKHVAPLLSNFAIISSFLNTNEIEIVYDLENRQNLRFGNTIISFAIEIATIRKINLFKIEELLAFALVANNQQIAINFTMKILQLCDSDQFIQQYMSVLCRIVSRFPFNNLIWQRLFQLLMNDKSFILSFGENLNLSQYNFSNGIRASILPLVLSALLPLFDEESMFSDNIRKIVFHILRENHLSLLSKSTIKIFDSFIQGSIFGIVTENSVSQTVFSNSKVKDFYLIFIENVNRIFYNSKKQKQPFYKFTSMLLNSMLVAQMPNFKRFSLILNIAAHSTNYFLIQTLTSLFASYIRVDFTTQALNLLIDVSLHALIIENDINLRDALSNNIFVYCIQNHERFVHFSRFFVFGYIYVSDDVKFRSLKAFKEYFDIQPPKTLNEIIPYLYILLCTDLKEITLYQTKPKKKVDSEEQKVDNSPKSIIKNAQNQRLMNRKVNYSVKNNTNSENDKVNSLFTIYSNDSFAFTLFSYILSTFKQLPKENKLSLLLKYKDVNDLISNDKNEDNDLLQVKRYVSDYWINLQEEAFSSYKIIDLKGVFLPQDSLGIFLFNHFSDVAQRSKLFFGNLFIDMNNYLRYIEKYYGSFLFTNNTIISQNLSFEKLNEISKSYHISPFYYPGFCPVVLIPSQFQAINSKDEDYSNLISSNKIEIDFFGIEKFISFDHSKNSSLLSHFGGYFDYLDKNHRLKISFNNKTLTETNKLFVYYINLNGDNQQQQNILSFIAIYGRPLQIHNCSLIRKFIDIPAVLFKYKDRYLILSNTKFDGKEITFHQMINDDEEKIYESFVQSVFLNEFGQYYLFCGHPVLLIRLNDFIISHQCTDDTVTWSVGIFSSMNGSFVLSFSREDISTLQSKYQQQTNVQIQEEISSDPPSIYKLNSLDLTKQETVENWLQGRISNIHYITLLNIFSGRSFDDMSSYPIMPRVLTSFEGSSFKEDYRQHLRNFMFPVSVLSEASKSKSQNEIKIHMDSNIHEISNNGSIGSFDESSFSSSFNIDLSDPCFDTLKMRYRVQKYHNCENISNGSIVSSFMIRIPPFVNYSLQFNDGKFDTANRIFSSINVTCGINLFSTFELIPELFLMPEMLINETNRIELPEGVSGDVILPKWCIQSYISSQQNSEVKDDELSENTKSDEATEKDENETNKNEDEFSENKIIKEENNNNNDNDMIENFSDSGNEKNENESKIEIDEVNMNDYNNENEDKLSENNIRKEENNNDDSKNGSENGKADETKAKNEKEHEKSEETVSGAPAHLLTAPYRSRLRSLTPASTSDKISCHNFIQMHRSVLESMAVRMALAKWIDLVFGFKQSGEEAVNALNLYNPLSYQSSIGSLPSLQKSATSGTMQSQLRSMRADFVKNSGQMPLKIFTSPHQVYSSFTSFPAANKAASISASASLSSYPPNDRKLKRPIQKVQEKSSLFGFSFDDVCVRLIQFDKSDRSCLNRAKGEILINQAKKTIKLFNADFFNASNICLSKSGSFLAVTFVTSKVKIFRFLNFQSESPAASSPSPTSGQISIENENNFSFIELSVFSRESVIFSVINDRQFLCASVCKDEVILWSVINGFIVHIIPLEGARCLEFDEELNMLYIGAGMRVHQFSLNGELLRTIDTSVEDDAMASDCGDFGFLENRVESVAVGGFGFSYDTRFVAVGKRGGTVSIYRQDRESLGFELVSVFEVSSFPIVRLFAGQNKHVVEAVDSCNSLSTVF